MDISFESVIERDIDFLLMRRFSESDEAFINLFLQEIDLNWNESFSMEFVAHSVMTSDGESDVEIIINSGNERIALLIEDKINAVAQPEQSKRYEVRAKKALEEGRFDKYHIFIVAPQKYLSSNQEAANYDHQISYESMQAVLKDEFEKSLLKKALDESRRGYVPIEDRQVTAFWNAIYDYADEHFPGIFRIYGKRGESRGSNAHWVNIDSGRGTAIRIKADRGYVDLEISGYADKMNRFLKANQELIDRKKLYIRLASKSLAIREYINVIDFSRDFSEQVDDVEDAFCKAKELQDLIKELKF